LRNFVTQIKIGTLDHFVLRRKWNSCLSQSVASSILPSHDGVSVCNCFYCDKEGLCYWIRLRTHLPLGCLWHAVLLHEDMPGFIIKHNMQQEVIANRNIVYHFRRKYRTMNTIMWFSLLKNVWFITMHLQIFPTILNFFLCCRDSHWLSAGSNKHKWMVVYICVALYTFQVLSYLGHVLLSAVKVGWPNSIFKCETEPPPPHSYPASWYYQFYLFTNWCTSELS